MVCETYKIINREKNNNGMRERECGGQWCWWWVAEPCGLAGVVGRAGLWTLL